VSHVAGVAGARADGVTTGILGGGILGGGILGAGKELCGTAGTAIMGTP
jgi:hypothetical protein